MINIKGKSRLVWCLLWLSMCGGTPNKTACMYGGVTLHDNNRLTEEKKVPINLWLDGKQNTVPLETVKTNKKNVTVQELDLQSKTLFTGKI